MTTKLLIFIGIFVLTVASCSCSTMKGRKVKKQPDYVGVDAQIQPYVNEFKDLAKKHGIEFQNEVSVGVTDIKSDTIIGLCTYRNGWREIDLDAEFLKENDEYRKKALIFHELVHCYCTRGHDFGEDQNYPENTFLQIFEVIQKKIPWCLIRVTPGYFGDGCPITLMHPFISDSVCLETHWDFYLKEMFDRCEPF